MPNYEIFHTTNDDLREAAVEKKNEKKKRRRKEKSYLSFCDVGGQKKYFCII